MNKRTVVSTAAFLALVSGFCAVCILSLLELRRDRWEEATRWSASLATALAQDIGRNVRSYDLSLQSIASHLSKAELTGLSAQLQQSVLFDGAVRAEYLGSILVLDAQGNVVRDAGSLVPRQDNFSDRAYFQAQRDRPDRGLFISAPFTRRLTGSDEVIALSRRIDRPDGSFGGVVVATMRLAFFKDLFERTQLRADDALNLFLDPGIVVMRTPFIPEMIGRNLSDTHTVAPLRDASSGSFTAVSAVDGVRRLYSYTRVGDLPLFLDVALSEDGIFANWRARATVIGGALALCCLLAGALGLSMLHQSKRRKAVTTDLRRSEAQYRLLADHATDVIMQLDRDLVRRYVSPACRTVLGYEPAELMDKRTRDVIHPDDWPLVERMVRDAQASLQPTEATYRVRHRDGHDVWMEGRYRFVPKGEVFIVVLREVSRRKEAERQLAKANLELADLAHRDALTGLANRRRFDVASRSELGAAMANGTALSMLLMDVDRFKSFNDRYGHPAGDDCLRAIGTAIAGSLLRPSDLAVRYGGEEFAVLLPGADEEGALQVAERIRKSVEALAIAHAGNGGGQGFATISIGCATASSFAGSHEEAVAALVADADRHLYEAKRLGRNRVISRKRFADAVACPVPPSETTRLTVLDAYRSAGAVEPSSDLDGVARLAAAIASKPTAFVSLVERDAVRVIGRHHMAIDEIPRPASFCAHTIMGREPLMVPDLRLDPRFHANPYVCMPEGLRFYTGVPLVDPRTQEAIGSLCVADTEPGALLGAAQLNQLKELAAILVSSLSRRLHPAIAVPLDDPRPHTAFRRSVRVRD